MHEDASLAFLYITSASLQTLPLKKIEMKVTDNTAFKDLSCKNRYKPSLQNSKIIKENHQTS